MFSKEKKLEPEAAPTPARAQRSVSRAGPPSIISASLRIVGNLVSDGDIQVDGAVDGDVQSRSLTISQGGSVNGSVAADTVRVDGAVIGQIKASNVLLGPTAHVTGDIIHASLVVEAGACADGHVRRIESDAVVILMPPTKPNAADETPLYSTAN